MKQHKKHHIVAKAYHLAYKRIVKFRILVELTSNHNIASAFLHFL